MDNLKVSLADARRIKGLTQKEAADAIGISVDSIGNYERGKSYPDIPVLKKIEQVYGVKYDQIIFLPLDYDKTVNIV